MTDDLSKKVIESHSFSCRGITKEGEPAFSKKRKQNIVVNVFGNGNTHVLCNYESQGICNYDCAEYSNSFTEEHQNCRYVVR